MLNLHINQIRAVIMNGWCMTTVYSSIQCELILFRRISLPDNCGHIMDFHSNRMDERFNIVAYSKFDFSLRIQKKFTKHYMTITFLLTQFDCFYCYSILLIAFITGISVNNWFSCTTSVSPIRLHADQILQNECIRFSHFLFHYFRFSLHALWKNRFLTFFLQFKIIFYPKIQRKNGEMRNS